MFENINAWCNGFIEALNRIIQEDFKLPINNLKFDSSVFDPSNKSKLSLFKDAFVQLNKAKIALAKIESSNGNNLIESALTCLTCLRAAYDRIKTKAESVSCKEIQRFKQLVDGRLPNANEQYTFDSFVHAMLRDLMAVKQMAEKEQMAFRGQTIDLVYQSLEGYAQSVGYANTQILQNIHRASTLEQMLKAIQQLAQETQVQQAEIQRLTADAEVRETTLRQYRDELTQKQIQSPITRQRTTELEALVAQKEAELRQMAPLKEEAEQAKRENADLQRQNETLQMELDAVRHFSVPKPVGAVAAARASSSMSQSSGPQLNLSPIPRVGENVAVGSKRKRSEGGSEPLELSDLSDPAQIRPATKPRTGSAAYAGAASSSAALFPPQAQTGAAAAASAYDQDDTRSVKSGFSMASTQSRMPTAGETEDVRSVLTKIIGSERTKLVMFLRDEAKKMRNPAINAHLSGFLVNLMVLLDQPVKDFFPKELKDNEGLLELRTHLEKSPAWSQPAAKLEEGMNPSVPHAYMAVCINYLFYKKSTPTEGRWSDYLKGSEATTLVTENSKDCLTQFMKFFRPEDQAKHLETFKKGLPAKSTPASSSVASYRR